LKRCIAASAFPANFTHTLEAKKKYYKKSENPNRKNKEERKKYDINAARRNRKPNNKYPTHKAHTSNKNVPKL